MLKILSLIMAMFASQGILVEEARAQQANFNYLSQTVTAVVSPSALNLTSTVGAFTNVATQQSGRQSCWIQYKPVTAPPGNGAISVTNQGFVFFGSTAPATVSSSFALNAFQILNCEQAGEVDGSGIWVSSTTTSDTFTIKVK